MVVKRLWWFKHVYFRSRFRRYAQVMSQLHKLIFIEQQPPQLERDVRRRYIDGFKRQLFGQKHNAGTVKEEGMWT